MNFNHWYIFHFVQWPFVIFLVTSWFDAHRISGLYRQNTEPSAISQLHHHWKFYYSRSSAKIEINSNLMEQGQGYMVNVTSLPKPSLNNFWRVAKDVCGIALSWWKIAPLRFTNSGRFSLTAAFNLFSWRQ